MAAQPPNPHQNTGPAWGFHSGARSADNNEPEDNPGRRKPDESDTDYRERLYIEIISKTDQHKDWVVTHFDEIINKLIVLENTLNQYVSTRFSAHNRVELVENCNAAIRMIALQYETLWLDGLQISGASERLCSDIQVSIQKAQRIGRFHNRRPPHDTPIFCKE